MADSASLQTRCIATIEGCLKVVQAEEHRVQQAPSVRVLVRPYGYCGVKALGSHEVCLPEWAPL